MWFWYALIAAALWGAADLFYKKGNERSDARSALKTVVAVGFIMGVQAAYMLLFTECDFKLVDIVRYLPVSALYILSMFLGYVGLRYIELSVSSPIQNSSGALTAVLLMAFFGASLPLPAALAIALITIGVVLLAVFERDNTIELSDRDKKYRVGVGAVLFPIAYCIIDALGTFADGIYLDELEIMSEDTALIAYELTFFICGAASFIYLLCKGERFSPKGEKNRLLAASFETAGQFFYVFAMARNAVSAAPLVASYCVFSVLLARVFLKEKLSAKQYAAVAAAVVGIVILGSFE